MESRKGPSDKTKSKLVEYTFIDCINHSNFPFITSMVMT